MSIHPYSSSQLHKRYKERLEAPGTDGVRSRCELLVHEWDTHRDERRLKSNGMDPHYKWATSHYRSGRALVETVTNLFRHSEENRLLFFTFTMLPKSPDGVHRVEHAARCFKAASKTLFPKLFHHMLRVMDVDAKGGVHFHGIAIADEDVRTGFCPEAYDAYKAASKQGVCRRELARLRSLVSTNSNLHQIWQRLDKQLKRYGFGLHGVFPIREDLQALRKDPKAHARTACYLRASYYAGVKAIRKAKLGRTIRGVQTTRNFPNKVCANQVVSQKWEEAVLRLRHLFDFAENKIFSIYLGKRWGITLRDLVKALDECSYPSPLGHDWRSFPLGTGSWLARILRHMILTDGYLKKTALLLLPILEDIAKRSGPNELEPSLGFWEPIFPCDLPPHVVSLVPKGGPSAILFPIRTPRLAAA